MNETLVLPEFSRAHKPPEDLVKMPVLSVGSRWGLRLPNLQVPK